MSRNTKEYFAIRYSWIEDANQLKNWTILKYRARLGRLDLQQNNHSLTE